MRQRDASTCDPWSPLTYVVRRQGPVVERPACQRVAGQRVEVNTLVSSFEKFGEIRLVECIGESERVFILSF